MAGNGDDSLLRDFGGTFRVVDPGATLERIERIAPVAGISRVANVTGLDSVGVPTWMAVRPLARSLSVSQGKGATHVHAKASAIMEAIELFHAEHLVPWGDEVCLIDAEGNPDFIEVAKLPVRPEAGLSPTTRVSWIPGLCLITGRPHWLPRQIMDLDLVGRKPEENLFASSTSGLASGNSIDEAIIHAVCEVVERDHMAFWLVNQELDPFHQHRRLAPETVDDAVCAAYLAKIHDAGLRVAMWDLTSELGLPCFTCSVFDERNSTMYQTRASGAGCHPNRNVALARAISEALQSRLTFISGIRDDIYWRTYSEDIDLEATTNRRWLEEHCAERGTCDFRRIANFGSGTLSAECVVAEIVGALHAAGFGNVILTDLSCAEIGVAVVHVFIPGMEPQLRPTDYSPGPRMIARLREIRQI